MPDYTKSKIYKITSSAGLPYIGSTVVELNKRFNGHKNLEYASKIHIAQPDCKIELIENYPCNSKKELVSRERYWIENINCCNHNVPIITKEEALQYKRNWYCENKEHKKKYAKNYRDTHKTFFECSCGRTIQITAYDNHINSALHRKGVFMNLPFCEIIPIRAKLL